jgi:putative ABC transport system permease protein
MGRLAWSQLRFRSVRLIALVVGLLLATTAFTVLTAASRTSQLRTVGTVTAHFVPAYDILVRPTGARTQLETRTDTVQPNFLSGIYGGITTAQYHEIASIPGVQVAAPIAMVGYTLISTPLTWPLPRGELAGPGRQLYRTITTWVSDAGASRVSQPPSYLYVTPNRLKFGSLSGGSLEEVPGSAPVNVCPLTPVQHGGGPEDPFGVAAQSDAQCWSKADGYALLPGSALTPGPPRYSVSWVIPVLIAAIDPAAEAKLDGLNKAVVSGGYLAENAHDSPAGPGDVSFPVLASNGSGMDEYAVTRLEQLATPKAPPKMDVSWMAAEAKAPDQTLTTEKTTAQQAYGAMLRAMGYRLPREKAARGLFLGATAIEDYRSVGPVSYQRTSDGALTPLPVHNPATVWYAGGFPDVSMDNADNQYRAITVHAHLGNEYAVGGGGALATARLVGIFNPGKVESFDPLSEVPLGPYQPVVAVPGNAASRRAMHGSDLLPNTNLGGYVSQPVNLITSLSALPALENSVTYGAGLPASDPISVIRVRVVGVTGPNALSLERIKEVAQQIEVRTHLDVDIVTGSSPSATTIDLPPGKFGQPALTLTEGWVKKGVATAILTAIDKNSLVLFTLILIVCILFVANSASAAVRGRRRELGVLACLGWTRPRIFATVLGELAAIGLTAGVLGAVAALPLSSALGLHASPGRAALAVPVAVAVAVIAGLVPAWLAARAEPVASVRPPVLGVRRTRQPGGVAGLAAVNVLRTPGRALIGAISLAVGITALTLLAALTFAFRGVLVGSLLGNAVAVQVRGVDYVAVTATITLGVLAVADVVFLNISERAAELAAIRAFGWRESALSRLVVTEGAIIGLTGSLIGAGLGLAAAAKFAGQMPVTLYPIAAGAVATGVFVTAAAALIPARALLRRPVGQLLAEE